MLRDVTMAVVAMSAAVNVVPAGDPVQEPREGQEWQDSEKILRLSNDERLKQFLGALPKDFRHKSVRVPMRDGIRLAGEIGLPPGDGPFPIYLRTAAYSRFSHSGYHNRAPAEYGELIHGKPLKWGFVAINFRGIAESEGETVLHNTLDDSNGQQIRDALDTVLWVKKQPWCNGVIIMGGNSGNGVGPTQVKLANAPVTFTQPGNSAADYPHGWGYVNGVRRGLMDWFKSQNGKAGGPIPKFPVPTIAKNYNPERMRAELKKYAASQKNIVVCHVRNGWYDLTFEDALCVFEAYAPQGNMFATIGPNSHGGPPQGPVRWPGSKGNPEFRWTMEYARELFLGKKVPARKSQLMYYVFGDARDESAPGNEYRVTHVWPVPSTPMCLYLHDDGVMRPEPSEEDAATLDYTYNPKDPIKTHGGANYAPLETEAACYDQRDLAYRKDILRFASRPLENPLEITGKVWSDVYLETDVPDTTIMVDLIDIYPDGTQVLMRDSALMARYHSGWDTPSMLEVGEVYKLKIDLMSIALAFNTGHRIGIQIRSSSTPKFEVHPNTYEPVNSYDQARVAHHKIHLSKQYPSRIILPTVRR